VVTHRILLSQQGTAEDVSPTPKKRHKTCKQVDNFMESGGPAARKPPGTPPQSTYTEQLNLSQ
jgi:hypothetical protein